MIRSMHGWTRTVRVRTYVFHQSLLQTSELYTCFALDSTDSDVKVDSRYCESMLYLL